MAKLQATLAPVTTVEPVDQALYEVRKKIYPRAVHGAFAAWRWIFVLLTQLVFYGVPWLQWNERQAVLFDLAARKFYIFGLVFWPQDVVYLSVLLIICAFSLFLFTAVAGRVWCGYACPQTVYTEIFMWIERQVEGDRLARMKLDKQKLSARKFALKGTKHVLWIALALWTGFTFVGFFTPIVALGGEVLNLQAGPWETFWMLFYGLATYGNAGWMREQVCKYMCPYARFQGVMFDPDTLVITYDRARGESRGARSRSADRKAIGLGDCVDCGICVQVCPTGIDIRNGLQYECIGCAACIDGCDQVMDKMGYPKGLIRYTTENALHGGISTRGMLKRILRPRVLVYTTILWSIIVATLVTLYERVPLKVNVIRDRGSVMHDADAREAQNVYRLRIMNTQEVARDMRIAVSGLEGIEIEGASQAVRVAPASSLVVPVRVEAPRASAAKGSNRIEFTIEATDPAHPERAPLRVVENASFVVQ
ncbi:MAG: cytochrome c oxidase accessory protein CcoG [Betaproteobacteria bacterium]